MKTVPGFWVIAALAVLAAPTAFGQDRSFLQVVLRVAGISATPSALKGPGDEPETGDVWVSNVAGRTRVRLTRNGGYRSPVFAPGNQSILALKQNTLVAIPVTGGKGKALHTLTRPLKLAGFDPERSQEVLTLFQDADGRPWLGFVAVPTGQVTPLPHNPSSPEHRAIIAHVKDWERVYGSTSVYVKTEVKQGVTGAIEWTDVYLARGADQVNVSRCDGVSCGQPSLSSDGRHVAFVKTAP